MLKIDTNFHTHTYRCGHAGNFSDEAYVLSAIENGFKVVGFSDHAPFKDIIHPGMRMDFAEFDGYLSSLRDLKEKYKDKITILIGLEIEYYEEIKSYYDELYVKYNLDYLIVGQHLRYKNNNPDFYFGHKNRDLIDEIKEYEKDLIKAINSGYFSYVCHPDLFFSSIKDVNEDILKICEEICIAAKNKDIPLEINLNGMIQKVYFNKKDVIFYPSIDFFRIAKKVGNKFIIGIDAHHPERFKYIPFEALELFLNETGIKEDEILKDIKLKDELRK